MRATIRGVTIEISPGTVEEALAQVEAQGIRDHFVVVGGRRFPIKQALEAVTGIDRSDFTTHQARSLFRRLGFVLGRARGTVGESGTPYRRSSGSEVVPEALLRSLSGRWVAIRSGKVVASAGTPQTLVAALRRRSLRADRMFRVTDNPQELPGADM